MMETHPGERIYGGDRIKRVGEGLTATLNYLDRYTQYDARHGKAAAELIDELKQSFRMVVPKSQELTAEELMRQLIAHVLYQISYDVRLLENAERNAHEA